MDQDQYTLRNLFEGTECISQEMLLKYVDGQLSKPALRKVELHLIDCPLCESALEGVQEVGTKAFTEMLNNLDARIEARELETATEDEETDNVIQFRPNIMPPVAARKPNRLLPIFGIAATVTILAVVGWLFVGGDSASSIADRHFQELALSGTRSAETPVDPAAQTRNAAAAAYANKDFAGAAALFDQQIDDEAIYQAGSCYYQAGNYDLAATRFTTLSQKDGAWKAYGEYYLALTELKMNRLESAQQHLQSISENPDHTFGAEATKTLAEVKGL